MFSVIAGGIEPQTSNGSRLDSHEDEWFRAWQLHNSRSRPPSPGSERAQADAKLQEHECAAAAGSLKAGCPICYEIDYMFRRDVETLSLNLGSLEFVLWVPCGKHQPLILSILEHYRYPLIEEAPIQRLVVFRTQQSFVNFNGHISRDVSSAYAWGIRLLPNPGRRYIGTGRVVKSPWIQPGHARRWINRCNRLHGRQCSEAVFQVRSGNFAPQWVIDIWRMCLIPGAEAIHYAALSYVWGSRPIYTTTKTNLRDHQKAGALETLAIPGTIRDALVVFKKLGQRYCWIDALCIVQDDERTKYSEIQNMSAVFANASFTLVAEGPEDAQQGLAGISQPREFGQQVFELGSGIKAIHQRTQKRMYCDKSTWGTRAWTFQERLFSKRLLIFDKDSMRWQCQAATWCEDVIPDDTMDGLQERKAVHEAAIQSDLPDSTSLAFLLEDYNVRSLTFPTDALFAFMGTLTALQRCYKGSFISGLPQLFFDIALLWQPASFATRRHSRLKDAASVGIPSWSWSGWECLVDTSSWHEFMAYKKQDFVRDEYCKAVVPTVQWYYHHEVDRRRVAIEPEWYDYRTRYFNKDEPAPSGWTKHDIFESSPGFKSWPDWYLNRNMPRRGMPSFVYRHEKSPNLEFWYPIPLPEASETTSPSLASFISCHTRRSWLTASSVDKDLEISLATADGRKIGKVKIFLRKSSEDDEVEEDLSGRLLEIVELSKGHSWKKNRGNRHYYNVMWIEWQTGFACRKGVGIVDMNEWDRLELEYIDLTLG